MDYYLDTKGFECPIPVLKAEKFIKRLNLTNIWKRFKNIKNQRLKLDLKISQHRMFIIQQKLIFSRLIILKRFVKLI